MKKIVETAKRDIVYVIFIFTLAFLYGWELTQ